LCVGCVNFTIAAIQIVGRQVYTLYDIRTANVHVWIMP